ncbi:TOBE domain-containing protein [Sulfurovum sp. ST-21]|uniref:TOBE domain-containing protein n=1 Tax=Sulfurovum indicum TaxID=2779528 RepID=A0A7M1S695_9BACT|nr:TOBE domain-containing protein [Sulfurovum indicum]QOR62229.1 TOBE domain-containing protein [Sulfurovum indicum]
MELSSKLTVNMLGEPFLLEKRIELLYAIEKHGSISKAAKAVPMSYKSAWEAVDAMNNLSEEPIVQRETGGKNGGGTTITPYGMKLLETYRVLKEEHDRFLERLSQMRDIESRAFKTIGRLAMQISARNQIQGRVESLALGAVNANVCLKLKSGKKLVSVITKEAVENLGLEEGESVTAIFKSSTVMLAVPGKMELSARNSLKGSITRITVDEVNAEVIVDIGYHDVLVAVITVDALKALELKEGSSVIAIIKSSDVMLGR